MPDATTDTTAESTPDESTPEDSASSVPEPSVKEKKKLRWGQYIVEHFSPEPGDCIVIRGPDTSYAEAKRDDMAETIITALKDAGVEHVAFLLGPSATLSISHMTKKRMRALGYIYDPDTAPSGA